MIGQHGTTWFLAGAFTTGAVVRECDVPEGTTLFFPVINSINFDTPGQCGQGEPLPASFYRDLSEQFVNGATNLSVTVDGDAVRPLRRAASPVFAVGQCRPTTCFPSVCCRPVCTQPAVDEVSRRGSIR